MKKLKIQLFIFLVKIIYYLKYSNKLKNYLMEKCFTEEGPHSKSTTIKWKEGHNLLKQLLSRPSNTRKRRNLEFKTFFDWFTDNSDPINDEIAELIRDDLYPNPLQYYLVPDVEIEGEGQELVFLLINLQKYNLYKFL